MPEKKVKWTPIANNVTINAKLLEIAFVLEETKPGENYSLLTGNSGISLFHYYYWLYSQDEKHLEKGNNLILNSFSLMKHPFSTLYSFCSGAAGFMWTIDHLVNNMFIEGDCYELFSEKESYLFSMAENDMRQGKYDFLHNAIGVGLYFMNRNDKYSIGYIESLLFALEKTAEKDDNKLKWRSTIVNEGLNKEVYNLSLSHGIASIIAFLSRAYNNNILKSKVKDMLSGAVNYLLSLKADTPNHQGSFFPSYVYIDKNRIEKGSRLAWCYGDLGIGITLWQASQALHNKEWEKVAVEVLLQTTLRKDPVKEMVIDAGICHGASGIAHIYNRLYHYTCIEAFRDTATYWLNETINKAVFKDGFAGYKTWKTEKFGGWVNESEVLEGIAGIGLVLLAAISNIEPKWDESLLLS